MGPSDRIVAEARGWIGTPYVHGGALRGAGCDCLGLIRGVRRALGGVCPDRVPPYPPGWALRGADEALRLALGAHLRPLPGDAALAPGQVLLFRLRPGAPAGHLGVLTEAGPVRRMVHAYDRHGVTESPLGEAWARRIVARYALI
jgi:NlpC/P60 family putative phage cell wall peptidase